MHEPIVSVLINNHNYARFLGDAITSALSQTYPHTEVIVIDDGSTDDSRQVLESFGSRITAHAQPNAGQAAAINRGFSLSHGQIVLLLDADDTFFPEKAAEVVRVFASHPGIGWCFHPASLWHVATSKQTVPSATCPSTFIDFRQEIANAHLPTFAPATSCLCFARSLLADLLPLPEREPTAADRYLKLGALILSPGFFLDTPLTLQKIHDSNDYTLKPGRSRVEARSLIHAATWLRSRFPLHANLANKLFAMGLGIYRRTGGPDPHSTHLIHDYLASTPLLSHWQILLRSCYHSSRVFAPIRHWRTRHIRNP
ncbi:MAG: glycosyltransferase family 2 protein [Bacillota bacterium]